MSWCKPYELKMVSLLQGLTVQNIYTELRQGSKKAVNSGKEQHCILTDPLEEKTWWPGQ